MLGLFTANKPSEPSGTPARSRLNPRTDTEHRAVSVHLQACPQYQLVVSSTAKRNYFLNKYDLLSLKTMTSPNKKYKNRSPIRYYIQQEVQERSRQKTLQITRSEQLCQCMIQSMRAKEAHMKV